METQAALDSFTQRDDDETSSNALKGDVSALAFAVLHFSRAAAIVADR
jgi:hypothetical protein